MFGNKSKGTITFSYNSKDIFNDVMLLSSYMCKNIVMQNGSALDEFAISEDEEEVYKVCVKQTLPAIYDAMIKITSGVDGAFNDSFVVAEEEKDGLCRKEGTYIEFTIKDNKEYNKNVLSLVDATLRDCVKYGTLTEFYSISLNGELFGLAQDKFVSNISQLKQRLFQLKKKSVSSHLL